MKRLLTSLLGWREFDGVLQASGWIGKEPGQDWLGATTVLLDKASFDIPRNKFRTERVHLGGGRLDLFARAGPHPREPRSLDRRERADPGRSACGAHRRCSDGPSSR